MMHMHIINHTATIKIPWIDAVNRQIIEIKWNNFQLIKIKEIINEADRK